MKILPVSEYNRPHIGGLDVVVGKLAQGLAKLDHQGYTGTCKFPGTHKCEELYGVEIFRIPVPRWEGKRGIRWLQSKS